MKAVRSRNTEIVEKLVGHGAKVSAIDKVNVHHLRLYLMSKFLSITTNNLRIFRKETLLYILRCVDEVNESLKFCYGTPRTRVYYINLINPERPHIIWTLLITKAYYRRYLEPVRALCDFIVVRQKSAKCLLWNPLHIFSSSFQDI